MLRRLSRKTVFLATLVLLCWTSTLRAASPWLPFGPDGGDARRIAADPSDPAHLYLGTANGWIYESRSSGANWRRVARVGKRDDLVLDSIVVDRANPRHLIVGAYVIGRPDGGLFLSNDGGLTWINQAEMRGQSVRSLTASLSDPRILVAGTLQGVFRSIDGGQRWKLISPPESTEIHEVQSVAIDPGDPKTIYAGTWHLPWKTTDAGEHWEFIKEGIFEDSDVFSIIIDPTSPSTIYASACSGIYKSENGGHHFTRVEGIPKTAIRTRALRQDPQHREIVFAGTTEGLFRSQDAGKTWTRTPGPEIIVNDVSVDSADPRHILIATDRGGVLASDDGGDTFHSSNEGFSARQITTLKRDAQHPATLFVGVVNDKEWGGVFQSDNGGLSWDQRSDGLQGRDVFSLGQAPDGTMIAGTSHGLYRLDSESESWKRVEDAPGALAGTEPARPPAIVTRPPVPVGRNHFALAKAAKPASAAQRKAALLQRPRKTTTRPKPTSSAKSKAVPHPRRASTAKRPPAKPVAHIAAARKPAPVIRHAAPLPLSFQTAEAGDTLKPVSSRPQRFDGKVYGIITAGHTLLASTSVGLLSSPDDGITWAASGPDKSADWRFLAAANTNAVAASLHSIAFSSDSGATWAPIAAPAQLTLISAVSVEPSGVIWVGGREGVFISPDAGTTWSIPKNLYVNAVNNIFFDESTNRMLVTTGGDSSVVFTVQLPQNKITFVYSGWSLRFARPVGDHLVAATLFDGIVVEPKMVPAPAPTSSKPLLGPVPASSANSSAARP